MKKLDLKPINHDSEKLIDALGVAQERAEELILEVKKHVKEDSISKVYESFLSVSETANEFAFMVHAMQKMQDILQNNPLAMLAQLMGGRV
ncbi:hypothetical protein [Sphingobacterium sp. BIGb0116]|uniref:hypothetical protein n=1 Tax=Sphingobacterium sp. BIGb0116 TaxID=2940619 RepID=UPI002168A04C|nr:hypothetical protein [Sphingobacterium sp. BIGb0116]MCS4164404.1 hypothetical protein [Sphingobacterium sp. BIGb0116]